MAIENEVQEQEAVLLQLFDLYWFQYQILTNPPSIQEESPHPELNHKKKPNKKIRKKRARRSCDISKSALMLEFEELKGFMDLGFEFSEEDQGSPRLVSILPGLHKLGCKGVVSRTNLSEVCTSEEIPPLLMMVNKNWKIPSLSNEDDMKSHLRTWAQAVASAVR